MIHGERRRDKIGKEREMNRTVIGYSVDRRNKCLRLLFGDNKFEFDDRFEYDNGLLLFGEAEFDLDSSIVYYLDNYRACSLERFVYECNRIYKTPEVLNSVLRLAEIFCGEEVTFDLLSGKFIFRYEGDSITLMEIIDDCVVVNTELTGGVAVPLSAINGLVQSIKLSKAFPFRKPFYECELELGNLSEEELNAIASMLL